MNTLEEFEKRLSNLLDFIEENKDELTHKHNFGLYLSCIYIKDDYPYNTGAAIGTIFNISCTIRSFFRKHPEISKYLEKII